MTIQQAATRFPVASGASQGVLNHGVQKEISETV